MGMTNVNVTVVDPKRKSDLKGNAPVQQIPDLPKSGDAQLPVQPPVGNVQPAGTNQFAATDGAVSGGRYATQNENAWSGGLDTYNKHLDSHKGNVNPTATTPMTGAEYAGWLKKLGVEPEQIAGTAKTAAEGTAGADEMLLSDQGYGMIQAFKAKWESLDKRAKEAEAAGNYELAAQLRAERDQQNVNANKIRAGAGYYGGTDGSMYIPVAQLNTDASASDGTTGNTAETGSAVNTPEAKMKALLNEWKTAVLEQTNGQIDYAVEQAVKELERALEDAQPQFKEQAESVSLGERQAMDNAALYAELRGDKGGIGQEQYNSIQNTAAQNRLAVQQAQMKLSTDTARQIADLRAQGEFDKADTAFEITQEYLSKLMELEQWAAQYNLSMEQFNTSLKQWEAEYELTLEKLGISQKQWATEMALKEKQYDYDAYLNSLGLMHTQQSELAETGWVILKMGIVPDQRYLDAMRLDAATAQQMAEMMGSKASDLIGPSDPGEVYQMLYTHGYSPEDKERILALLTSGGMDYDQARIYYNAYANGEYEMIRMNAYDGWGSGLDMVQRQGQESSDWDQFYAMIETRLKNGNRVGVERLMEQYSEQLSREQYTEIRKLFAEYGFAEYNIFGD